MELPSEDQRLEGRDEGRGRWSLRGKGSEMPGAINSREQFNSRRGATGCPKADVYAYMLLCLCVSEVVTHLKGTLHLPVSAWIPDRSFP